MQAAEDPLELLEWKVPKEDASSRHEEFFLRSFKFI